MTISKLECVDKKRQLKIYVWIQFDKTMQENHQKYLAQAKI